MLIDGIDHLSAEELESELAAGGRFVFYEFCISLVVLTLRCPTRIRFVRPWKLALLHRLPRRLRVLLEPVRELPFILAGLPCVVVSLLFGWWGLPWGIIYTPLTLFTNLCGGQDVTDEVCDFVQTGQAGATEPAG